MIDHLSRMTEYLRDLLVESPAPSVEIPRSSAWRESALKMQEEEKSGSELSLLDALVTCPICRERFPEGLAELACGHNFCAGCLRKHVRRSLAAEGSLMLQCPDESCRRPLEQSDFLYLLNEEQRQVYEKRSLESAFDDDDSLTRCPSCNYGFEKIAHSGEVVAVGVPKDDDGNPLTEEALRHREEHRVRCPECTQNFCVSCRAMPYHLGRTCEQFRDYTEARKCRFCKSALSRGFMYRDDVCMEEDCVLRADIACSRILPCGHACGGVAREPRCLPCLECEEEAVGQGKEDFCNICWVEDLGSAPSILLACGHVFHFTCVKNKLRGWPGARITFKFMNCPLCSQEIDHPLLRPILDPLRELRKTIMAKAVQRLKFEGMERDERLLQPGPYYRKPAAYAMDKFAYYMCSRCESPYFGGQRRCEDAAREGADGKEIEKDHLVCGSCSAPEVGASVCDVHGKDYIEFKCKFCCAIASWFCWGTTHFCDACHTRQMNNDYMTRKKPRELMQCAGAHSCPLKVDHPPAPSEFSLGCALCRASREASF
eukprot:PLAT15892.1.p1 GENE.PLAT15892.1~~PLAT15892.1.p1  ORF type:complete len:615 (-),score=134.59 PLAT15892.1:135-1763(-)